MVARTPHACRELALVVMVLAAAPATAAEGVNLAWNHCMGEGTGVQNVTFACNTNNSSHTVVGSFIPGRNLTAIIGLECVLDLAAASASLPPWWQFHNTGACRVNSLAANVNADLTDAVCMDWSQGEGVGGLGSYCTSAGECSDHPTSPNVARIKVAAAVAQSFGVDLTAGTEYFGFNLVINHQKTVGTGSCAGCTTPVCIVLNSIDIVGKDNIGSRKLTTPTAPGSNFISWQGGGVPVVGGVSGCPAATATRHSAWGEIKSLYR